MTQEIFTCADCQQTKDVLTSGGTGYGIDAQHNKICYACCAIRDDKEMIETGRFVGYYTQDANGKRWFGNWCGTLKFGVVTQNKTHYYAFGRHRTERVQFYFYHHGKLWYGENKGDMQLARAKRLKNQK